jgi:hypothetical protein
LASWILLAAKFIRRLVTSLNLSMITVMISASSSH